MIRKENKISFLKITAAALLLSLILSVSPVCVPKTHAWDAIPAAILNFALKQMAIMIDGVVRGMQKQAAVESLQKLVGNLVTNGDAGALFVTDWTEFIVEEPMAKADSIMNDLLSQTLKGRNKVSQYVSEKVEFGVSSASGYLDQMADMVKTDIIDRKVPVPNITSDPRQAFDTGNIKQLENLFSGTNWSVAYKSQMEKKWNEIVEQEKLSALAEGISGEGFRGKKNEQGKTITPAITIKDMISNAQDLPNKVLAGASNIGEVMASIINGVLNKAINKGIGDIANQLQKAQKAVNKYNNSLNDIKNGKIDSF